MNERIRKLAERAGLKVESFMTNPPKPFQILGTPEQFEKFALLIVAECSGINYNSPFKDGEFHAREVLERFGVEE